MSWIRPVILQRVDRRNSVEQTYVAAHALVGSETRTDITGEGVNLFARDKIEQRHVLVFVVPLDHRGAATEEVHDCERAREGWNGGFEGLKPCPYALSAFAVWLHSRNEFN